MKRIVLVLVIAAVCTTINAARHNYVITHYGVKNDSTVVQTRAIQAVIDKAEENGGGCVVVPRGTFLSGALFLSRARGCILTKGLCLKVPTLLPIFLCCLRVWKDAIYIIMRHW